jgi:cytochrome c
MTLLAILATLPVPRDLPLPLPLPAVVLKTLLVLFFLVHILFVNLTVGASVLVTLFEFRGLREKRYDALALGLAKTVTVNKSLAVVMGIGPLLCINLVYTLQWYGANALTGHAWLLIIPLVTAAFLLTYLHKYLWEKWSTGGRKKLHLAVGAAATLLFLCIPFIFLANVNLMLFPGEWEKVRGFFSSLEVGNVFPRYLHFLLASVALSGLFGAWWFWRESAAVEGFTRQELRRKFYGVTASATLCQFAAGPLLLFTLPAVGMSGRLYAIILPSAALGLCVLVLLVRKWRGSDEGLAYEHGLLWVLFSVVVLGMGSGRHAYREAALATQTAAIRERSAEYEAALADFNRKHLNDAPQETPEQLFATCGACHAVDHRLVGPPLQEIARIYAGNPEGIVTWAKAPGKKRPDYPQMPPFAHLGEEKLRAIAGYVLEAGSK